MSGNVTFYYKNILDESTTITATSIPSFRFPYLYNYNLNFVAKSVGSNDSTPEVLTLVFYISETIDVINIIGHNLKKFTVEYYNGSSYTSLISVDNNTATTSYFEFSPISTTRLKLTLLETISPNAEKTIADLVITQKIGEVNYNPSKVGRSIIDISSNVRTSMGFIMRTKFSEVKKIALEFPFSDAHDLDLFLFLQRLERPFYVLLNGGVQLQDQEFFRLSDMFRVVITKDVDFTLRGDLIGIGDKVSFDLEEAAR